MEVLICTTAFDNAVTGSAGVARAISEWTDKDPNYRVHILSEDCEPSLSRYNCQLNIGSKLPVFTYYFKSRSYWRCLKQLLKHHHFDVIIYQDIWLSYGARQFMREANLHTAIVAFMHDDNTIDMPAKFSFRGASWSYLLRWLMERSVINDLDAVLTNSEYMKKELVRKFQLPHHQVFRLYYTAHDYAQVLFKPKEIDPKKTIRILFVKNDFRRGGLEELLTALGLLKEQRFEVTVIGPSEYQVRRKIRTELKRLPNVTLQLKGKMTSWQEMIGHYHANDLLCVPSRKEALGLANAEAMAAGTAVVSTKAGGIPEVMNDGKNGFMSAQNTIADLVDNLRTCINDPVLTKSKIDSGRAFVLERFSIQKMLHELGAILSEVIQQRKQGIHST